MHPRSSWKFFGLFGILLWLAMLAPHPLPSPFTLALAQDKVNAPDKANFTISATSDSPPENPKQVGATVTLTATASITTPLTFQWTFGDGQTAEGRVVHHSYNSTGVFIAKVIASNGGTAEALTLVKIVQQITPTPDTRPPTGLSASCTTPVVANNPTSCIATVTGGSNVKFSWSFGDNEPGGEGGALSHVYKTKGTYLVTVVARNDFGTATQQILVEVTEEPIAALSIQGPSTGLLKAEITFTATVQTGTNVQYFWLFGDGSTAAGKVVPHAYQKDGSYLVTVLAQNSVSNATATKSLAIFQTLPTGLTVFNNSPQPVNAPIRFIAVVANSNSVVYDWDFGDGQTLRSTESIITHAYSRKGKYPVIVTAVNNAGAQQATMIAYVDTPASTQTLNVKRTPEVALPGEDLRFDITNPFTTTAVYTWTFGDGQTQSHDPSITHRYTIAGMHSIVSVVGQSSRNENKDAEFVVLVGVKARLPLVLLNANPILGQSTETDPQTTVTATVTAPPTTPIPTPNTPPANTPEVSGQTPEPQTTTEATPAPSPLTPAATDIAPTATSIGGTIPPGGTIP